MKKQLKLHLGCGSCHLNGYHNIDIIYRPGVDVIDNVLHLRRYKPNTVDLIYASHVLEHIGRWEYPRALERWCEILKPGGTLRLAVPDFEAVCRRYLKTGDLREVSGLLYGGQDYDQNFHKWCWDMKTITKDLIAAGFAEVERYDWRNTDHADVDDFSKAYLPHMDQRGMLMSLNVEAVKR
jgi:predicted SAM-dependent methyltransferase